MYLFCYEPLTTTTALKINKKELVTLIEHKIVSFQAKRLDFWVSTILLIHLIAELA
jgi:hypothetical protein